MAKASTDILKEYLVSIGFAVDEHQQKRAKSALEDISKTMKSLASTSLAAATALSASVIEIATSLEKLYFASQRTGASVTNIQALQYGAEQIGVSAQEAQGALEGMTRAMRLNPGLVGLLKSLNINPDQDKVQVLMDLIDHLRRMPFYQGAQVARLFGIDDNTLVMLEKGYDKLKAYEDERRKSAGQAGIDADSMAEKSHNFMVALRGLEARFGILWDLIAVRFMPIGEKLIGWLDHVVDYLIKADKSTDGWSTRLVGLAVSLGGVASALKILGSLGGIFGLGGGGGAAGGAAAGVGTLATALMALAGALVLLSGYVGKLLDDKFTSPEDKKKREEHLKDQKSHGLNYGYYNGIMEFFGAGKKKSDIGELGRGLNFHAGHADEPTQVGAASPNVHDLIRKYSEKFGVDTGLAEAVAWAESRFNQNALSKKGAIGTFQLMPKTATGLGVDPKNLEGNVQGGLRYLSDLLKQFGGNESLALAAYNAGEGNVKKYGGVPPFAETQGYVRDILNYKLAHEGAGVKPGVTMSQKTEITVTGTDAKQIGSDILKGQDRVNGDLLRNLVGVTN